MELLLVLDVGLTYVCWFHLEMNRLIIDDAAEVEQ